MNEKTSNKERCILYLEKYAKKDLAGVGELFAEDIILRDWKIRVVGKENALAETQKNFEAVHSLDIAILELHESESTLVAELRINVDAEVLYVVDIITFNLKGQITSIRAYKGRGDN